MTETKYNSLSFYSESNEWKLVVGNSSGDSGWENHVKSKTFNPMPEAGHSYEIPVFIYSLKLRVSSKRSTPLHFTLFRSTLL